MVGVGEPSQEDYLSSICYCGLDMVGVESHQKRLLSQFEFHLLLWSTDMVGVGEPSEEVVVSV